MNATDKKFAELEDKLILLQYRASILTARSADPSTSLEVEHLISEITKLQCEFENFKLE